MLNGKLSTSGFLCRHENTIFVRFTLPPHNVHQLRSFSPTPFLLTVRLLILRIFPESNRVKIGKCVLLCMYDIRVIDCMLANAKWQGDTSGKGAREDSGQMGGDELLPFKAAPNFQRQQRLRRGAGGLRTKTATIRPQKIQQTRATWAHTLYRAPKLLIIVSLILVSTFSSDESNRWLEFQGSTFLAAWKRFKNLWLSLGGGCTEERGAWKGIINVIETKNAVTQSLFANLLCQCRCCMLQNKFS